jgi:2,5-diketo-D-gluconate reductase B
MGITDPEAGPKAIRKAIEIGYRHLDTAQKYENETIVGRAISESTVPRKDLFVATKIEETNLAYDDVIETAHRSRDRLALDTIDLLYIHWPATGPEARYDPNETIAAFNELHDDGVINHVGVANFSIELIEEAQDHFDVPILANQVEMHPYLQQKEMVEYIQENDMYLVAYCPMMQGDINAVAELRAIAEKHGVTPGQVGLSWLMSHDNVIPIPKSGDVHLEENFRARDLELDDEDIAEIEAIDREKRVVNPSKGPWNW